MKYKQLTKEQFEALHTEFASFLASQQIDAAQWLEIKKEKPEVADEELDIFSDLVWEDVLNKTEYLEHFSKQQINLFNCGKNQISRIVVSIERKDFDFFENSDFQWFIDNTNDKAVNFYKGSKKYEQERNLELFDLIQKGSIIANGSLFEQIALLIKA